MSTPVRPVAFVFPEGVGATVKLSGALVPPGLQATASAETLWQARFPALPAVDNINLPNVYRINVDAEAPGYLPYLPVVDLPNSRPDANPANWDVCIGVTFPPQPNRMFLPGMVPTTPPPPTREQILDVMAGFCNNHDSVVVAPSTQGRPIFSPYFPCLSPSEQDEWIAIWQAQKLTHVAIMVDDPIYPEGLPQYGGAFYPAPSFAPTQEQFTAAFWKLRQRNLIPIVFMTTGEFPADWATFQEKLNWCVPLKEHGAFVQGWETYWSDDQYHSVYNAMRSTLGIATVLALHLPVNYVWEVSGPSDWVLGGPFGDVNLFLMQLAPYGSASQLPTVSGGWDQCICRTLVGTGCTLYLANGQTLCLFEHNAYYQIRDDATDADMQAGVTYARNQNVVSFGNTTEAVS